jgi:tetratricopeptide (TPR) repeat protein
MIRSIAAAVFLSVLIGAQVTRPSDPELTRHMLAMRTALASCDWETLALRSEDILRTVPRGSDAWIEASACRGRAAWFSYDFARFEEIAREVLALVTKLRRDDPSAHASQLGPLNPVLVLPVLDLELCLAERLQARDEHAEALGHYRLLMQDLSSLGGARDAREMNLQVGLDMARSLHALGRTKDAEEMLTSLRDGFGTTRQGAVATAWLEHDGEHPEAYRGKYERDEAHMARMRRIWNGVPAARARLATTLGWSESEIARPRIGVADLPATPEVLGAVTEGDPRRPNLDIVIVFHSEAMAAHPEHLEITLVHELAHATLIEMLGERYEVMPVWLTEGIAQSLCGEIDDVPETVLGQREHADPKGFLSRDYWDRAPIVFESDRCDSIGRAEAWMLVLELRAARDGHGLVLFLDEMKAGESWTRALADVTGLALDAYMARARTRAEGILRTMRQDCLVDLAALTAAREKGAEEYLAAADDILQDSKSHIVRSRALRARAEWLGKLRRFEESLQAWEELAGPNPTPCDTLYLDVARVSIVRTLIELGRRAEAEARLVSLVRDAFETGTRTWAVRELKQMRQGR